MTSILIREALGYHTETNSNIGANGASPIYALAGCIDFDNSSISDKRCGQQEARLWEGCVVCGKCLKLARKPGSMSVWTPGLAAMRLPRASSRRTSPPLPLMTWATCMLKLLLSSSVYMPRINGLCWGGVHVREQGCPGRGVCRRRLSLGFLQELLAEGASQCL